MTVFDHDDDAFKADVIGGLIQLLPLSESGFEDILLSSALESSVGAVPEDELPLLVSFGNFPE